MSLSAPTLEDLSRECLEFLFRSQPLSAEEEQRLRLLTALLDSSKEKTADAAPDTSAKT